MTCSWNKVWFKLNKYIILRKNPNHWQFGRVHVRLFKWYYSKIIKIIKIHSETAALQACYMFKACAYSNNGRRHGCYKTCTSTEHTSHKLLNSCTIYTLHILHSLISMQKLIWEYTRRYWGECCNVSLALWLSFVILHWCGIVSLWKSRVVL